jgi:hypothetical protein
MTTTVEIDSKIYGALRQSFGEAALKKKFNDVLLAGLQSRLEKYTQEILSFEQKYGVSFQEFDLLWDDGKIANPHSHEVEADYVDWEMLEMEKKELLAALKQVKAANGG